MTGHASEDLNSPNKATLGSVGQMPSVGGEVLPANVLGVVPQSAHLKDEIQRLKREKFQNFVKLILFP